MLRPLILAISALAISGSALAEGAGKPAATAKSTGAKSSTKKPTAPSAFGLTQALAVLEQCPESRFESSGIISLGGILQANKARWLASPQANRLTFMQELVAEENAKAHAWSQVNKVDCAQDVERGAAFWNKTIADIAKDQGQTAPADVAKSPGSGSKPATPVSRGTPGAVTPMP